MKYRVLKDDEIIQEGDVRVLIDGSRCSPNYDLNWIGHKAHEWRDSLSGGGRVERPVRKSKRPGLTKLLRRLPKGVIAVIYWDGTVMIETLPGDDDRHLDTIADLKAYLLNLPEREKCE